MPEVFVVGSGPSRMDKAERVLKQAVIVLDVALMSSLVWRFIPEELKLQIRARARRLGELEARTRRIRRDRERFIAETRWEIFQQLRELEGRS